MRLTRITAATAVIAALALTGCQGESEPESTLPAIGEETETPTPTPTGPVDDNDPLTPPVFEEPTSEEEAAEQAEKALQAYKKALDLISTGKGEPNDLKAFVSEVVLKADKQHLQGVKDGGYDVEGYVDVYWTRDPAVGKLTVGDKAYEFGTVSFDACLDTTTRTVTDSDGKPLTYEVPRVLDRVEMEWNPRANTWLVSYQEGQDKAC